MNSTHKNKSKIIAVLIFLSLIACRLPFATTPGSEDTAIPTYTPQIKVIDATPTPLPVTQLLQPTAVEPQNADTPLPTKTSEMPEMPEASPLSAKDRARHNRIFSYVWRMVNRRYVYPSFNDVDWTAVREEYAPLVETMPDDEIFWQLMQDMVGRLQDDHSAYLTPDEVEEEDQAILGDLDYVGIGVYVTVPEDADYAVVLFPMPGGPAETAGVLAHDRILEIDGLQACCDEEGYDNLDAMLGPAGSTVTLVLQQSGEAKRQVDIERSQIQTQLPISSRIITSTMDSSNMVGYILVPTLWDQTIAERTREVLQSLLDSHTLTGLVVDMRINGGGAYTELYDLLSLFTQGEVGAFYQQDHIVDILDVMPDPVANSQDIPMIVLVGSETESYAEVFSGVMQAQGRAKLVGESTAGNVETVYPYDLEDGSRLWLAEETFAVHGESNWEDAGVQPDITVQGRWEDITEEDDPALETAVAVLTASTEE